MGKNAWDFNENDVWQMKELSIIILSYNTKSLTEACIKSVINYTKGIDYEVIVVDNASSDGSAETLKKIDKINLIQNKSNVGFAAGNNQAIEKAKGKYVLLLNSDTLLTSDILKDLVKWMDKNPEIGIMSCELKNKDGTTQATGGYFPTLGRVINWMFFVDDVPLLSNLLTSFHPKLSFYKKEHELDWVTGAFFLTRQEVWRNIKGLDEEYFMYVEEVDFCYRAKMKGWRVFYNPMVNLIHYGGASSRSTYPILSEFKGLKIFYKKHFPKWQSILLHVILKIGALIRMIVFGFLKGKEATRIYAKAFNIA